MSDQWHEAEPTKQDADEADAFLAELLEVAERHIRRNASRNGLQLGVGRFSAAVVSRLYGPKAVPAWHFAQGDWTASLVDPGKAH